MMATSSGGRPTAVSTITKVKSPAEGTPAAPTLAAIAVILKEGEGGGGRWREGEGLTQRSEGSVSPVTKNHNHTHKIV